jgi:Arc/MetJ-type ribon-helix-helix transcriptional regulator
MTMMTVELPDALTRGLRGLVSEGWYASEDEALREAVRDLITHRRRQLQEHFQMKDIASAVELAESGGHQTFDRCCRYSP